MMYSRVLYLINLLRRGAKTGVFLTSTLLILLALGIWFYGPALKFGDYAPFAPIQNRVIAIAVLVVLWGINNYFLARSQARKKPKTKAEEEIKPYDPVDGLIALINQSFRNTMKIVRSKWTGKERGVRSLYALPWYLVIGPSDSGKSSLIKDADLNFPLAHLLNDNTQKTSANRDVPEYWVTSEGLLFDIPGTWLKKDAPIEFSEFEDDDGDNERPVVKDKKARKRIWDAFLTLLSDYRPRRPINGVIVNVDLVELIRMNDQQRQEAANNIHAHLVDIAEKLGTRFTIHVVLTKIDKFAGFSDYFALFSKAERKIPFGFSFPVYSEIEADQWVEDFEQGFARFLAHANNDMIDRLFNQREADGRRNIYVFLRELAASGPVVQDFFRRALISDKFSTPPLVRGIYFTSVRQEGVPFNALLHRIALEYRMRPPVLPAYSGHSSPYFTDGLFNDIIFKEAGLAGDNKQVEQRKQLFLNVAIVASVLFVLGFGFLLDQAMRDNQARAERVVSASNDYINLPRDEKIGTDETHYVAALNAIAVANNEFPGWQDKSDAQRYISLYQGRRIGPEVQKAYEELLRKRYLPAIAEEVKAEIVRLGKDPETYNGDARLDALRVYLLLGDIERRKELDADGNKYSLGKEAVMTWMQNNWQKRFEGQKNLQADLSRHLLYVLNTDRIATPLDLPLVAQTQEVLREVPRDVRLYRNLRALAAKQVPGGISMRTTIGPSFDIIFKQRGDDDQKKNDIVIPYFYTKKGFFEFFVPMNNDLSVIAVADAWVTGEREKVHYSDEDLEAFREKIRHAYATDYINTWSQALNSLDIVEFGNVDQATRVIAEINGPANPFGRIINLVKAETEIYEAKPAATDAQQQTTEITFDSNLKHGQRIARAFVGLSQLLKADEGTTTPFEALLIPVSGLETYMRSILTGQQSSKPVALERAKERAKLQGSDPIFIVRRTGSNLPQPFDRLFSQIADNSWKVILAAAKNDLQTVWQSDVYRSFNVDLSGKYPFSRSSKEEVSLQEFQRFFGPDGDFDRFFNDNLKVFIHPSTGQPIVIDGQSLNVSAEFMKQVSAVRSVRDIFFSADGVPTLHYTVEPVSMTGDISRAVLNIEGQLVPYSHGPTMPKSILWPNALSSKQDMSRLSISRRGGSDDRSYQGLWSSFRLFDNASVTASTPESVDVTFTISKSRVKYRLRMSAMEKNPFAMRSLSELKLPERL